MSQDSQVSRENFEEYLKANHKKIKMSIKVICKGFDDEIMAIHEQLFPNDKNQNKGDSTKYCERDGKEFQILKEYVLKEYMRKPYH